MKPHPDIEAGIARTCQFQKDSWNMWTGHIRSRMVLQAICALYAFLTIDIPYMPFFFISLGVLCTIFTVASDRNRAYWVAQWDERIAEWIEFREAYNERNS